MDASHELSPKPLLLPEIITFPTEIDISNSDSLSAALTAAIRPGAAVVIADLSRTEFCDVAGIRCLLAAHDRAVACGVELRAVIPARAVWRLLVLLGGDTRLRVYGDMEAGLTGVPAAALRCGADGSASTAADISARCRDALRAARQLAEHVARTRDILLRQPPVSSDRLLRNWEFARLYKRVSTMPVIEQAKGILMFYERCSADEAFDMLRRASQRSNVPVRDIAVSIVQRTSG